MLTDDAMPHLLHPGRSTLWRCDHKHVILSSNKIYPQHSAMLCLHFGEACFEMLDAGRHTTGVFKRHVIRSSNAMNEADDGSVPIWYHYTQN